MDVREDGPGSPSSTDPGGPPIPGVRGIDHTADIGIEIAAPSLPELFRRASLATVWLVTEEAPAAGTERRSLSLSAEDLPSLLRACLKEILFWHQAEGFTVSELEVQTVNESQIEAIAVGGPAPSQAVREIKGVTWHGLTVEERDGDWLARVIFDV